MRRGSSWCAIVLASVLGLAACSSPSGVDGSDAEADDSSSLALTEVAAPGVLDATTAGILPTGSESAGPLDTTALSAFPDLAARAQQCGDDTVATDGSAAATPIEVVQADRQILGVRCQGALGPQVLYGDVLANTTWTSAQLVSDEGARELETALGSGTTVSDVRFGQDGALVLVSADGRAFQASRADTDALLTEAGRVVRGAVRSGGAFTGALSQTAQQPVVQAAAALPPPAAPEPPATPSGGAVDCAVLKCVALTFDDGPGNDTPRLLQILANEGIKATFFMVGKNAKAYPAIVKAVADAGHELGNHTWNHPDLTKKDEATIRSEIESTTDAIVAAAGRGPTALRPPYGAKNDLVLSIAGQEGLAVVNWNIDSLDWKSKNTADTRKVAVSTAKPGGILLMHDIHSWTVDAVPGIIADLRAQGYTFVTVEQLMGGSLTPGQLYYGR